MTAAEALQAHKEGKPLSGANLWGANLWGANLSRADLWGANLSGANLTDAKLEWRSHDLVAELLRRRATNDQEFAVAGFVLMRRDWCWKEFLACDLAGKLWAIAELQKLGCPHVTKV